MPETRNDYDVLAQRYQLVHEKPDIQISILPTIKLILGDLRGKTVLDLGCGDGFFAREIMSLNPKHVIGVDNSRVQLELAMSLSSDPRLEYLHVDMFVDELPRCDVVLAPFVLNYASSRDELLDLLNRIGRTVRKRGGRLIATLDYPSAINLRRFGSEKKFASAEDGAEIDIALYNQRQLLVELKAHFFKMITVHDCLQRAGFLLTKWVEPVLLNPSPGQYSDLEHKD